MLSFCFSSFMYKCNKEKAFNEGGNVMTNRILQHSQRRIDVYWRSAMRYISELPVLPDVVFGNMSEQAFADYYEKLVEKAEKLRLELASE